MSNISTLGSDQSKNPVNNLQWLFKKEKSNQGLYTESEVKRNPEIVRTWTAQEWLSLTKHWGEMIGTSDVSKVDTWYQINWQHSPVVIEKDKKDAILKFKMLASWLEGEGWRVSKNAGRA